MLPDGDGAPIGLLQANEEVARLTESITRARIFGLAIAAVTMGLLFASLLLVVRRADRILSVREMELARAYDDLRRSESLRFDLVNMIVHDLRGPLTAITTSLDLSDRVDLSQSPGIMQRFLDRARQAARRMSGLIDEILTSSKIEAGELTLNRVDTSIADLLQENVELIKGQAEVEKKRIRLNCPPDLRAELDAPLIGRVLQNLLGNALKFTRPDDGMIAISAGCENGRSGEGVRLIVRVCDNGPGVPDDYKQAIFDKYGQVRADGYHTRKGTGLGLAFCRLVVNVHGGEIHVEDAAGGGSEFVFWVPQ